MDGHLKFFTLGPDIGHTTSDIGHRTSETQVILYYVQCCHAVHWTDNDINLNVNLNSILTHLENVEIDIYFKSIQYSILCFVQKQYRAENIKNNFQHYLIAELFVNEII